MKLCKLLSIIFYFCAYSFSVQAQKRQAAFEMNQLLGRGINMGNSFEAPSEEEWGNPWKPEYFKIMHDLGFDHVRLPIRWEPTQRSNASAPYTIEPTFLARIKQVVDTAIKNDLYIIINMHHHEELYENPIQEKERFLAQWFQIADFFKEYPSNLLFEVLNEPHGNLSPDIWNVLFADALTEIRETNPSRMVLMGTANYGGLGGIPDLVLPDDENIILTVHYYNPFSFTHQGAEWVGPSADDWLGTKWLDTEAERETVENEFKFVLQFSQLNHIPIHVGEFGAYNKADIDSRTRWTTFLSRWFEQQNMSWAYWEFSAGFGIYDPETRNVLKPIADALLINEMPEPVPVVTKTLYQSNFTSGTDGWSLNTQGGASGSLSANLGKLNVVLTNGGTEAWHAQLIKNNIALTQDKTYKISFTGKASENRNTTFYAGKASDPWTGYSGHNSAALGLQDTEYEFSFTMSNNTDPAARLVFDLGNSTVGITLTEIKIEEVSLLVTGLDIDKRPGVSFYPNPVANTLNFKSVENFDILELFDLNGRKVVSYDVDHSPLVLNLEGIPQGIYLIKLSGDDLFYSDKIFKE